MLGSPCSPCCKSLRDLCIRFVGSGFTNIALDAWQSTENADYVLDFGPDYCNNIWYGSLTATRQAMTPYGAAIIGKAIQDNIMHADASVGMDAVARPTKSYFYEGNKGQTLLFYNMYASDPNDPAYVEIRVPGNVRYRKYYTLATVPDISVDAITFIPEDAYTNQSVAGTVTVQALPELQPDAEPRLSIFAEAAEVSIEIIANEITDNLTFSRCAFSDLPYDIQFRMASCDNCSVFRVFASNVFQFLVISESSCTKYSRLRIEMQLNYPTPGVGPQAYYDYGLSPVQNFRVRYLANIQQFANIPPIHYYDDYQVSLNGVSEFPILPVTFWDGPRSFEYDFNSGLVAANPINVAIRIVGVE